MDESGIHRLADRARFALQLIEQEQAIASPTRLPSSRVQTGVRARPRGRHRDIR